ncbi:macrophage mannose receptor 1 [Lingula anatina]|uniref:Macrophage mannose receptor 1 n=1 Tax=Lingula anatina TaxID=7574 RepID=A0A1S3HGI5_LINAN|nr:macrophage mannose receptor 1 [Lingula anatina]|eukprot:XP_013385180.1 macrophage mannose receptor 1 [Lingula anatina]
MHCYIRCVAFHVLFVSGTAGQETCERKNSVYYNHRCFEVIHEDQSWSKARFYCENQGGHLAAIDDKDTDDFIKQMLLKGARGDVWIGALSRKRWFWADTNREIGWTSWAVHEPNDAGGQEDRVALWKDFNYEWNDERADTTYLHRWDADGREIHGIKSNAVCEYEGQTCSPTIPKTCVYIAGVGSCYCLNADLSDDRKGYTWGQANAMCTSTGARLAHVDNRATMDALIRQIQNVSREQWQFGGNYWIGAVWNRTAPFKWIWETGGKVNYSNWLNSPQMNPSIIQAAKLAFKQDFMWMSESITSMHHFICQFGMV